MGEETPLRSGAGRSEYYQSTERREIEMSKREWAIRLAAMYMKAAVFDRRIDHKTDERALRLVEIYYESKLFKLMVLFGVWGYLVLTFVEDNSGSNIDWQYFAETACWLFLAFGFLLRVSFTETRRLLKSRFAKVHALALLVALVDLVASWVLSSAGKPYFRYARVVRPILQLEYNQVVRRRVIDILRTTYRVRAALFLLLFHITFFAVISMFLFYGSEEGRIHFGSMPDSMISLIVLLSTCNSPRVMLPAFRENKLYALYFVLYLVVSVFFMLNLVLAVVYNEHRRHLKREAKRLAVRKRVCSSAAFRVLYTFSQRSTPSLRPAETLSRREIYEQGIPYDLVSDLLLELDVPRKVALAYSGFLDSASPDRSGFITRDDFEDILVITYMTQRSNFVEDPAGHEVSDEDEVSSLEEDELLENAAEYSNIRREVEQLERSPHSRHHAIPTQNELESLATRESFIAEPFRDRFDPDLDGEDACPFCITGCGKTRHTHATGLKRFAIKAVMHHIWLGQDFGYVKTLDFFVNFLLIASGILTIVVISVDAEAVVQEDPWQYAIFNSFCSLFFATEIMIRIHAAGAKRFFQYAWNIFEFTIVSLSFLGVATQFSSLSFFRENHHLFLFIRKLRLLRLLRSVPQFRLLTEIMMYLVPALSAFGLVIFTFMYMYAILGMGLFGKLELPPDMDASTFATFPLALLTLFELMVVNDWNATMAAFKAATQSDATQLFFVFWYFFAVIVMLNSVTSFALEALDIHITHSKLLQNVQEIKYSPKPLQVDLGSTGAGQGGDYHNRELKRSMSVVQRFSTVQKLGEAANSQLGESNIVKLLQEVFDEEVDEPTTLEIDQELTRLGLAHLVEF